MSYFAGFGLLAFIWYADRKNAEKHAKRLKEVSDASRR